MRTLGLLLLAFLPLTLHAADWPALPEKDGPVEIPAQEWPLKPGPRTVRVLVRYPGGERAKVDARTGAMLTLHNWGGTDCVGTADPVVLARELNVVALCVNYLQSGRESIDGPEPYDFGHLQALDALRVLWWMRDGLIQQGTAFDKGRLYATGGSGGGNVTLMANKLAPRTFAAVVDLCGMAKLSHDVAFGLPGGSDLTARYVRKLGHPFHLSRDDQELRFVGMPEHLAVMKRLGSAARVIVVHGTEDRTCPVEDARELAANYEAADLAVEPHWIAKEDLDGQVFMSAGHALGNRTQIVLKIAGKYLRPDSPDVLVRRSPTDFDLHEEVRYPTANGEWVISYAQGFPVSRFESRPPPPKYPDHVDLSYRLDAQGQRHPLQTVADWELRRAHVREGLQQVMGRLPGPLSRGALDVKVLEETRDGGLLRKKVSYQSDPDDRVNAWLIAPADTAGKRLPAMLCLHQTTRPGKDEPAGLAGDPNLHYAKELAQRGYVTLSPDYPSFGEHPYDFAADHGYESGSMKAVWDNLRSVDLLETLDIVDKDRIGVIGHSLGGHSAIFTAVFDVRLKAVVTSCGFTRFGKDDLPSWTGPRYMPKIATVYQSDAARVPFDFPELLAALAPRAVFVSAAKKDDDFDVTGVEDTIAAARPIYTLYGKADTLQAVYPDTGHGFPPDAREHAYEFLGRTLRPQP